MQIIWQWQYELHAFGEDGSLSGWIKVFIYTWAGYTQSGFCCWNMPISSFLWGGGRRMLLSTPSLKESSSSPWCKKIEPVLHLAFISNKRQVLSWCLTRLVECITNLAEQALDNFSFLSLQIWLGKSGLIFPSSYESELFYVFRHWDWHSTAVSHLNLIMGVKEIRLKSR